MASLESPQVSSSSLSVRPFLINSSAQPFQAKPSSSLSVTLVAGAIIGLCYGWRVSLVGIACMPLTIAVRPFACRFRSPLTLALHQAGIVRLKVVVLKDVKNKKSHEQSAQMACEAAGAIRTVASLTREDDCCEIYSQVSRALSMRSFLLC